jgi:hypothetical protein
LVILIIPPSNKKFQLFISKKFFVAVLTCSPAYLLACLPAHLLTCSPAYLLACLALPCLPAVSQKITPNPLGLGATCLRAIYLLQQK